MPFNKNHIVKMEFYYKTTGSFILIGQSTIAPYSINFDTNIVPNGAIFLKAVATDVYNNKISSIITVTVNNDALNPSIPDNIIVNVVDGDSLLVTWDASYDPTPYDPEEDDFLLI